MGADRPTQQRVIDSVTISIEPSTQLEGGVGHSAGLLRVDIGQAGYGQAILWIHRSEAHRLIGAIAQAMSSPPQEPPVLGGSEAPSAEPEPEPAPADLIEAPF